MAQNEWTGEEEKKAEKEAKKKVNARPGFGLTGQSELGSKSKVGERDTEGAEWHAVNSEYKRTGQAGPGSEKKKKKKRVEAD